MANTITLIFNIVCLVFLFFGMFWGLIRGAKKTLSRGLFLLLLSVVTIFVTAPLTKLILQIPLNFDVDNGSEVTRETMTLMQFLSKEIENLLGSEFIAKYPDFASALTSIPLILVNAIMYVIVFWLLKIILLPINTLFTKLFFGPKKHKEALGFASFNNSEYPSSDKSIEPLMDIYNKSQSEESSKDGMFIKKEDDISRSAPSASADRENVIAITQVDTPKTKKELRKEKKAEKKANRPKKHRLLGAGVGILVGMLVLFNTMVPVFGIMEILKDSKSTTLKNITTEETSLSSISNGITDDILKGYELSAIGRISHYIGMEQLGLITFDQVTSTKVDNKKIVLRKDISSLASTVSKADNLMGNYKTISDKGIENITQEELDDLINGLDSLIKSSEEVVLVDALSSYIIPIAVEYIVYNEIQLSDNPVINQAVVDTLVAIAKENDIAIFEELKTIVDIAKYLSDEKLLYPIVSGNYDNILNVFDSLDDDFGKTLTNKLFTLKTVNTTIPNILDMGLTIMDELTNFGYVEGSITTETAKNTFSSLFTSIAEIAKSLSYDSSIYLTDSSLPAVGKLLDTFKDSGIFNETTYNNLVDYAINIVKSQTSTLIPDNLKNSFNNHLLRNVCDVTSWTSEMTTIYEALQILRDPEYGILGQYIDSTTIRTGYSIDFVVAEPTLINIGKALDTLENSVLLGAKANLKIDDAEYEDTTFISLFTSLLKEANETIVSSNSSSTIQKLSNIITQIQNNLIESSHTYALDSTFWKDELTYISPLITEIYDMLSSSNDIEITSKLGTALDQSTHSIMLGKDTTLDLMHTILEIAKENLYGEDYTIKNDNSTQDNIYILLNNSLNRLDTTSTEGEQLYSQMIVQNNLGNTTTGDGKFWKQEITAIISLMNIADKANDITTIAQAQTISSDLDQVYESKIIGTEDLNRIIASVIKEFPTDTKEGIEGTINDIIKEIADTISSKDFLKDGKPNDFWQVEFNHFASLAELQEDIDDSIFSSTTEVSTLAQLGSKLDAIAYNTHKTTSEQTVLSYNESSNSSLITRNMISRLIISAFDIAKTQSTTTEAKIFNNLIENIQTSIQTISTQDKVIEWQRELSYIPTLVNLNSNETYSLDNASEKIGKYIDLIGFNTIDGQFADIKYDSNGHIIGANTYSYKVDETTKYYNSTIISRDILKTAITSLLDTFKITAESGSTLTDEDNIINELIDNLNNNINITSTSDTKYNSYATAFSELNNVKTQMDTLSKSIKDSDSIKTLDGGKIDTMLDTFQNTIVSGVPTTRKIALLIVNKVNDIYKDTAEFSSTDAGQYLVGLKAYLQSNIDSSTQTKEEYVSTGSSNYSNPFATLKSKIDNIGE